MKYFIIKKSKLFLILTLIISIGFSNLNYILANETPPQNVSIELYSLNETINAKEQNKSRGWIPHQHPIQIIPANIAGRSDGLKIAFKNLALHSVKDISCRVQIYQKYPHDELVLTSDKRMHSGALAARMGWDEKVFVTNWYYVVLSAPSFEEEGCVTSVENAVSAPFYNQLWGK